MKAKHFGYTRYVQLWVGPEGFPETIKISANPVRRGTRRMLTVGRKSGEYICAAESSVVLTPPLDDVRNLADPRAST